LQTPLIATGVPRIVRIGVAAILAFLVVTLLAPVAVSAQPIMFGVDVAAAPQVTARAMPMTYGSMWAGAWNQRYGWGGIESQLQTARANGLIPVIQWWYWGDDISPSCVENGCQDRYQGVLKNRATWTRMSTELADLVVRTMGAGTPAIIIIENEFNKGGIETYEPFDGYLAEQAQIFRSRNQRVVVGFGNWGQSLWGNFDRAAAASDYLGTQILYSSVREPNTYMTGIDMLVSGAARLQTMFGKPTFVTDVGFSSYPAPAYETYQDLIVQELFARMGELKAAGVRGIVWRMLADDPTFNTANYHGMAERHWGLLRADGTEKLAYSAFLTGMRIELGETPPTQGAMPTGLTAVAASAQVSLSWTAVNGAVSYNVKRSTNSGGPYTAIASGLTTPNFVNTGLVNGTTYYYVVSAVAGGEGANSAQVSARPVAPPPPAPTNNIAVWWPTDQAVLSGNQPFKSVLQGYSLGNYKMYWQVDNGQLNLMGNSNVDAPHKESIVNVATWTWRGRGPYTVTFVARDLTNRTLATRSIIIYRQ
jgi:hypothetical protein